MATNETITVKKLPFYLFLVLLGFLLFYVYDYMRDNKSPDGQQPPIPSAAIQIDPKTAKEYQTNYLAAQDSIGPAYKISAGEGQTLRGFWISKKTLTEIDESIKRSGEGRDIVGYSIYFGKTESFARNKKQRLNLVVRGTVPRKAAQSEMKMMRSAENTSPIEDAGDYFDTIDPCPIHCGSPAPEEP